MSAETFLRSVFVIYFSVVGSVLVLTPWSPGWHHLLYALPYPALQFLELPIARSCLSGFGLVHLVWATHDFHHLVRGAGPRHSTVPKRGDGATHSKTSGDQ